jgi:hypothetical protein
MISPIAVTIAATVAIVLNAFIFFSFRGIAPHCLITLWFPSELLSPVLFYFSSSPAVSSPPLSPPFFFVPQRLGGTPFLWQGACQNWPERYLLIYKKFAIWPFRAKMDWAQPAGGSVAKMRVFNKLQCRV